MYTIRAIEQQIVKGRIQSVEGVVLCEGRFYADPADVAQSILDNAVIISGDLDRHETKQSTPAQAKPKQHQAR
jgi:hypothetical protein